MKGRTLDEARDADAGQGHEAGRGRAGSRRTASSPATGPSVTILYRKLDPRTLGRLIALYEHRVFVEARCSASTPSTSGASNSARNWRPACCLSWKARRTPRKRDASTAGLVRHIHAIARHGVRRVGGHQGNPVRQGRDAGRFPGDLVRASATAWRCRRPAATARGPTHCMAEAGYDFASACFKADSVFAAGTNADIVALWYPAGRRATSAEPWSPASTRSRRSRARPIGRRCRAARMRSPACTASGFRLGVATNEFDRRRGKDAAGARRRADVRRRLWLRRGRQSQAGAGHDPRLLRPDRAEAVADRHGRRQPARPRNGARPAARGLAVGVLSGTGTRETLAPLADVMLGSVAELPDLLAERARANA